MSDLTITEGLMRVVFARINGSRYIWPVVYGYTSDNPLIPRQIETVLSASGRAGMSIYYCILCIYVI